MDPEVEARFERWETSFNLRMDRAEKREDARWKKSQARMEKAEKLADARWQKSEERMEKFDKRLEATRKLVETGMKLMVRMNARLEALTRTVDEMGKTQKLILKMLQGGRNGQGSH
jgi:hypothetical protein